MCDGTVQDIMRREGFSDGHLASGYDDDKGGGI